MSEQSIITQTYAPYVESDVSVNVNLDQSERIKVLLIEDDRTMRRLVRAKLDGRCDLITASSAMSGATLFRAEHPDLVLIDIELPDSSGHDLLNWMLKTKPETYAVMFSGYDDNDNIHQSIKTGAKGFISKPFDLSKLLFFIKQCRAH